MFFVYVYGVLCVVVVCCVFHVFSFFVWLVSVGLRLFVACCCLMVCLFLCRGELFFVVFGVCVLFRVCVVPLFRSLLFVLLLLFECCCLFMCVFVLLSLV